MSFQSQIIAVAKMKSASPFAAAYAEYAKRLKGKIELIEIEGRDQAEELDKIKSKLSPSQIIVALDETGKTLSSVEFSKTLENLLIHKPGKVQFILGGADGLDDNIRKQADLILSFGRLTWPHLLARVMLIEQIYRAQLIAAGHPYHREG